MASSKNPQINTTGSETSSKISKSTNSFSGLHSQASDQVNIMERVKLLTHPISLEELKDLNQMLKKLIN